MDTSSTRSAPAQSMKRQLFSALLPLVLFWAVEALYGLKAALVVGCVAAVIEIVWERFSQGKVSFLTWASNGLVLGLGGVSFLMDSGVAFKLQPAVMEVSMAGLLGWLRITGEPFMLRTFRDAPMPDPGKRDFLLAQAWFLKRLRDADSRLIVFFVIHGLAVAWAAIWGSSTVWILLKGVVFYVLLVLVMVPMYKRPRARLN